MYVRVGELKRPLSIRYAYVLTRLHFHPLDGGFLLVRFAYYYFLMVLLLYIIRAYIFSFLLGSVACDGHVKRFTIAFRSFVRLNFVVFARGYLPSHQTHGSHVCLCVPFTLHINFRMAISCYHDIGTHANQPTDSLKHRSTANRSFVCTHFSFQYHCLPSQMQKLMYVMSESQPFCHMYTYLSTHTSTMHSHVNISYA